MITSSYKDLLFWQTARETNLLVAGLIKTLPSERAAWAVSDQLLRACFSIGANIAEGFGKFAGKEYSRYIAIALGSANETQYWLELLKDLYQKNSPQIDVILGKNMETIKMLTATSKSLKAKKRLAKIAD